MKRITFLSAVLMLFMFSLSFSQWQDVNIPGGAKIETYSSDSTLFSNIVDGTISPEKSGTDFYYDSNRKILLAVTVDKNGAFIYRYNPALREWSHGSICKNAFFNWGDAAFFNITGTPGRSEDHYIVINIGCEQPDLKGTYLKGLYLICDGSAPSPSANPIYKSENKNYISVIRDLKEENVVYCWYKDDNKDESYLERIEINFDACCIFKAELTPEFDINNTSLTDILSFHQYIDEKSVLHQYLTAISASDNTTGVWYRNDSDGVLNPYGWKLAKDSDTNFITYSFPFPLPDPYAE